MQKHKYDTEAEADQFISEQGQGKTIIRHINTDGSKELHIIDGVRPLSTEERLVALESKVAELEKL